MHKSLNKISLLRFFEHKSHETTETNDCRGMGLRSNFGVSVFPFLMRKLGIDCNEWKVFEFDLQVDMWKSVGMNRLVGSLVRWMN